MAGLFTRRAACVACGWFVAVSLWSAATEPAAAFEPETLLDLNEATVRRFQVVREGASTLRQVGQLPAGLRPAAGVYNHAHLEYGTRPMSCGGTGLIFYQTGGDAVPVLYLQPPESHQIPVRPGHVLVVRFDLATVGDPVVLMVSEKSEGLRSTTKATGHTSIACSDVSDEVLLAPSPDQWSPIECRFGGFDREGTVILTFVAATTDSSNHPALRNLTLVRDYEY